VLRRTQLPIIGRTDVRSRTDGGGLIHHAGVSTSCAPPSPSPGPQAINTGTEAQS
jgi:hypothetical protein